MKLRSVTREKGRTPVRTENSKSLCRPAETHIRKGRSLRSTTSAKPEAQFEIGLHGSGSPKAGEPVVN
jgi:hypothetical protein